MYPQPPVTNTFIFLTLQRRVTGHGSKKLRDPKGKIDEVSKPEVTAYFAARRGS